MGLPFIRPRMRCEVAAVLFTLVLLAATGLLLALGRRRLDALRRRTPQGAARLTARRRYRRSTARRPI